MIDANYENKIEYLLESDEYYRVTPFLKIYPFESDFDNLEEYFTKKYLSKYSESIAKIILRIICYYESLVYLTEFYEVAQNSEFAKYAYKDIRYKSLDEINDIISYTITKGCTSLNIYIYSIDSLITIGGGFDTTVFSTNKEFLEDIDQSVKAEGLFFIKRNN